MRCTGRLRVCCQRRNCRRCKVQFGRCHVCVRLCARRGCGLACLCDINCMEVRWSRLQGGIPFCRWTCRFNRRMRCCCLNHLGGGGNTHMRGRSRDLAWCKVEYFWIRCLFHCHCSPSAALCGGSRSWGFCWVGQGWCCKIFAAL